MTRSSSAIFGISVPLVRLLPDVFEELTHDTFCVSAVSCPGDATVLEHGDPLAEAQRMRHLLLDDQQRRPFGAQALQRLVDLVDDDRRQTERELVGDQDLRHLYQ